MLKSCQQKRESRFKSFHQRCSTKKEFLKFSPNSQGNTCARVSFSNKVPGLRGATLLKKETLRQEFSCEFCEISKSTFPLPPVAASEELIIELITLKSQSITFHSYGAKNNRTSKKDSAENQLRLTDRHFPRTYPKTGK